MPSDPVAYLYLPSMVDHSLAPEGYHSATVYAPYFPYGLGPDEHRVMKEQYADACIKSIDRFDLDRYVQFSTYAAVTIIGELKRHFRDKGWAIRVPRRLQEVGLRVNAVLPELSQELGRSPTVDEIAIRCEASPEEILDAMEAVQAYSTTSLDSPVGEEGAAPIEVLGGDDPSFEMNDFPDTGGCDHVRSRARPSSDPCRGRRGPPNVETRRHG